jgi:hypothetical protein
MLTLAMLSGNCCYSIGMEKMMLLRYGLWLWILLAAPSYTNYQ